MRLLSYRRKLKLLLASTILTVGATPLVALPSTLVHPQEEEDTLSDYIATYVIIGDKPSEFQDFDFLELEDPDGKDPDEIQPGSDGNVRLSGYLITTDNRKFVFQTAILFNNNRGGYEKLIFRTGTVNEIYYSFRGKVLSRPVLSKKSFAYIALRGTLSKYQNGRRVASAKLDFSTFGIL